MAHVSQPRIIPVCESSSFPFLSSDVDKYPFALTLHIDLARASRTGLAAANRHKIDTVNNANQLEGIL